MAWVLFVVEEFGSLCLEIYDEFEGKRESTQGRFVNY